MNKYIFTKKWFLKNFVFELEALEDLKELMNFNNDFKLLEDEDLKVSNITDINKRKELDAKVLSIVSSNIEAGNFVDIGTYYGKSAARMSLNSPESNIYTVNISPEEFDNAGKNTTAKLTKKEIGKYYKSKNIENIYQIYANTINWNPSSNIENVKLAYIDGCHDAKFVFSDTNLIKKRLDANGFILWHDFNPQLINKFKWINTVTEAIARLYKENILKGPIFHVKNSFIGIWKNNFN